VSGLGVAIGPTSGGFLLEHFNWSSIFLINIPVVAACLIGVMALVPNSRGPESPKIDFRAPACPSPRDRHRLGPDRGARTRLGHSNDPGSVRDQCGIIATFIAGERHTDHPMLDVSTFRNLRFSAASISIAFVFFALMGVVFFLTTYLQSVLGFSALQSGVRCCRSRSAWS
jgi:MFS family permease